MAYTSNKLYGLKGLSNVGLVTGWIYRGARPTREGFKILKEELGINIVLNLTEQPDLTHLNMDLIQIAMRNPWNPLMKPDKSKVKQALDFLHNESSNNKRVYVHCEYGSDRTGVVIAELRKTSGWPPELALKEMKSFAAGLHILLSGYHKFVLENKFIQAAREAGR